MDTRSLVNFDDVVARGESLYLSFSSIHCPYFGEYVRFNASGLEHLKFKRRMVARPRRDQYVRFKLLHLAPEILRLSRTLQGVWRTKQFERIRMHSRTETKLLPVTFYEFIAVLEEVRVKIVVKQIENGEKMFWSIIPFWGVVNREGPNGSIAVRKLHNGNPAEE